MKNKIIIFIILLFITKMISKEINIKIPDDLLNSLQEDKVYTISGFSGNYANDFKTHLIKLITANKNIKFVDYDTQKKVIDQTIKYNDPVFDDKYNTIPNLTTPDIWIFGTADLTKSNLLFKRKQFLRYSITAVDIATGLYLVNINDEVMYKYNPPILLLIILIIGILTATRYIIHLKKGYKVRNIIICSMTIIILIVVWYLL